MLKKLDIGKKAFVVWLLWFFICISFWIIPGAKSKVEFFLFSGSFPSSLLNHYAWYYWDYQETFVFGIGPMILYVFVKTLFRTKN